MEHNTITAFGCAIANNNPSPIGSGSVDPSPYQGNAPVPLP